MDNPFALRKAEIVKVIEENKRTKRFLFRVDDFPPFKPGQFNMIYVYAQGEVPISISSTRRDMIEHTVRLVGEVTEDLFLLREGDFVGIRGPYGTHFPLEECEGMDLILLAGGLGLADLKPVVEEVIKKREKYGKVYLLIGAKDPSGFLYREEYSFWEGYVQLMLSVDKPVEGWSGHVGFVTDFLDTIEINPRKAVFMTCGPEAMMVVGAKKALDLGIKEGRIYLSMERHMKCAVGTCGHCQFGYTFVCKDGPVFPYSKVKPLLHVREV